MPDRLAKYVEKVPSKWRWGLAVGFVLVVSLATVFLSGIVYLQRDEINDLQAANLAIRVERATEKKAQMTAENTTRVSQCVVQATQGPDFRLALDLLRTVGQNQLVAARIMLQTSPNDPMEVIRNRKKIVRNLPAQIGAVNRLINRSRSGRNIGNCRALARELGVNIKPLLRSGT